MSYFPEEVVERIFDCITSHRDRNSASLVNKLWYNVDSYSRNKVFIRNCYALSPERLIARFPKVRSLTLKGKPSLAHSSLVPNLAHSSLFPSDWGGFVYPWIVTLANNCPSLEELRLKRMVVSDQSLVTISNSFPNFKSLVLINCQGFTTDGLQAIAANCKLLEHLDLERNEVEDDRGHWLISFPESCTSLVSLNFACLRGRVNWTDLERLVARCPNLRSLRLNGAVPLGILRNILMQASQLVDLGLGSGSNIQHINPQVWEAVRKCKSIQNLSGSFLVSPSFLPPLYPMCWNLISLNMSNATGIQSSELIELIRFCKKLQRLWILDSIGDKGLEVVADTCKDLQELRVFPYHAQVEATASVTEEGLITISKGCPLLHMLVYFCKQMTNAALFSVANNCPNLTCFRLFVPVPKVPDHVTLQPLDEGFGAIVQCCKGLRRLSLSGLLTDKVFLYIGMYAERLEVLSAAFVGESDGGMLCVLNGCKNVRKLEIMNCPFGDTALLDTAVKYETMQSLLISSCKVTLGGCKVVAKKMPLSNVEIINRKDRMVENPCDSLKVEKLYLYPTLAGRRTDAPDFVWTL